MNALELVKSITKATGFTRGAAVEVISVEPGVVTMRMLRKPELLQFNGFFHGGAISGLADHAAGAAATTALPQGRIAVTADLHVSFLRPASGGSITAVAKTASVGTTLCVVTVEVTTEAESGSVVCAIATATLRSVQAPPRSAD
ncbi:MAG: PaaI family thioesterase [Hyphomicrobiales bacterium]|nr:MAG: PaaI family thioesterase [Hyphomicrobiales bacterium]